MITLGIIFITSFYLLNNTNSTKHIIGGQVLVDDFAKKCKQLITNNPKNAYIIGSYIRFGKKNAGDMDIKEIHYNRNDIPEVLHNYGLRLKNNLHKIDKLTKITLKYEQGILITDPVIYQILSKMGTLNGILEIVNYDPSLKNVDISMLPKNKQEVVRKYIEKQTLDTFLKILQFFVVRHNLTVDDLINNNFYSKNIIRLRVNIIQDGYKVEYGLDFGKPIRNFKIDIKDFYSKDNGSINYYFLLKKLHNILKRGVYVTRDFRPEEEYKANQAIEDIEIFRNQNSKLNQDILKYEIQQDDKKMKFLYNKLNNMAKKLVHSIQNDLSRYLSTFVFANESFYVQE